MATTLLPPELGLPEPQDLPYNGHPIGLCWNDTLLFLKNSWSIPGVVLPWNNWHSGDLDELYPSAPNLKCISLHLFLFILQSIFLISLPFCVLLPFGLFILYIVAVQLVTAGVGRILNGPEGSLASTVDLSSDAKHEDEYWVFLNGVAVGNHWLQSNVNRLALTFRRPVTGVHNRTSGFIFDLIQCIVERNFGYATNDIRNSYAVIKKCLLEERHKKVVLILHSQGGIEGGLILDWLLDEVPQDILQKLEIYTFGSAANHFNNPHRSSASMHAAHDCSSADDTDKAIRHIEHYGNDGDFVARWGVLSFTRMKNRYMGHVFTKPGTGHLLNQHYLNTMFPLGIDRKVLDTNEFVEMDVTFTSEGAAEKAREAMDENLKNGGETNGEVYATVEDINSPIFPILKTRTLLVAKRPKVKHFSRLWGYRNGGSPAD